MGWVNMLFGVWTWLVFAFLYLPILLLIIFSFNKSKLNIVWTGFTLDWYVKLMHNQPIIRALRNSLIIAGFTTVISVILGTVGAWLLYRYRYPAMRTLNTLIFIPMVIPEIIMGISLLILFTVVSFGLGFMTIIISHVTFCFPFVLVAIQARLSGLDPFLEEAAMDLGATPVKAFWLVIVPYLLPAIFSGTLMSFTLSLDELLVTYFVASPSSATLPMKVFGMAKVGLNPMLNAISTIFILGTAVLVLVSEYSKKFNR
ncbi:MAG: ABC transporter permease [Verrucomicrobiae bacterium]|nr:ABC transporter permease [Verrucomicrobiae bacterium]